MSAATIHTPTGHTPTGHTPTRRSGLPTQRTAPPMLRLVPAHIPAHAPPIAAAPHGDPVPAGVQLTRRGRLVLLVGLLAVGAVLAFVLTGVLGTASPVPTSGPATSPTRIVVVQPGQTLWSIAREIAPSADRRDTIASIVRLNALPSTDVVAGTRLAVPAG
jgi:LysM domain-containing protein